MVWGVVMASFAFPVAFLTTFFAAAFFVATGLGAACFTGTDFATAFLGVARIISTATGIVSGFSSVGARTCAAPT